MLLLLQRPYRLCRAALFALLLLPSPPSAWAQTATLRFATQVVPDRNTVDPDARDEVEVTVLIRSDVVFGLGNTQLIFTFNDDALDLAPVPAPGVDYAFQNYSGVRTSTDGNIALYNVNTVTNTGAPDEVQVNVALATAGDGQAVPTVEAEVVRIYLKIDDGAATADLQWDVANTQVYVEDNVTEVAVVFDDGTNIELPVELASFEAVAAPDGIVLRWTTRSETANAGFEVEVADAGGPQAASWRRVAFVEGGGTTQQARQYEYRIAGLDVGLYRFRLRQVDYDGTAVYGPEVERAVVLAEAYRLTPAYPNPFNPQATFTLAVREAQPVRVAIYDALGRRAALLHDGVLEANRTHAFVVDGSGWASGIFFYEVVGRDFRQVGRLLLMK